MIDLAQRYKGIVFYNPAECRCLMDIRTVELIKKDLEDYEEIKKVLEILKRAVIQDELFKIDDDGLGKKHKYVLVDYDSYHASYLTPNEYNLIKEWLDKI